MPKEAIIKEVREAFKTLLKILEQDKAERDLIISINCVEQDIIDVITGELKPQ